MSILGFTLDLRESYGSGYGTCAYLDTSGGAARRRYRHTSQQPNRPKNTKITGLPKRISSLCSEGIKHAELFGKRRRNGATGADCESKPPGKRSLRRRGRGGARHRAEPLAIATRIPPRIPDFLLRVSVCFRHLRYRFFAHLSHVFSLVPAAERVREDKLSSVFPVGADDVVFHYVGYEVLRKVAVIHDPLPALFYVLYEIVHGVLQNIVVFYLFKIRAPKVLVKIGVLVGDLRFLDLKLKSLTSIICPGMVPSGI